MAASVRQIYELVDRIAPFETAEAYDNVGILAGRPDATIDTVLVALDLTPGVLEEARALGAQLILTHHPILFHARRNLREDDPEGALLCELVRSGCALIAAHTNYDKAAGGVSEVLASALALTNIQPIADGLACVGAFEGTLSDLAHLTRSKVNAYARVYGADRALTRVGVAAGAAGEHWPLAQAQGAEAFVTGEARHHDILCAVAAGMAVIDAGHGETERLSVKALVDGLQTSANALQYNVRVMESKVRPF